MFILRAGLVDRWCFALEVGEREVGENEYFDLSSEEYLGSEEQLILDLLKCLLVYGV